MYRQKLQMAKSQDDMTQQRLNNQKSDLELLTKTPQELKEMMPESQVGSSILEMAPSQAIKSALDSIDSAKNTKNEIISEAVQKLANMNITEDLMLVHQGKRNKEDIFQEKKSEFTEMFKKISEEEQKV